MATAGKLNGGARDQALRCCAQAPAHTRLAIPERDDVVVEVAVAVAVDAVDGLAAGEGAHPATGGKPLQGNRILRFHRVADTGEPFVATIGHVLAG
jgi:hypothetical protein